MRTTLIITILISLSFSFIQAAADLAALPTTSVETTTKQLTGDCRAALENGVLTLENSLIRRRYKWNNGNLISQSLEDKSNGQAWNLRSKKPDCTFPGTTTKAASGRLEIFERESDSIKPAHLNVVVTFKLDNLEVKRSFRIYPDCPAIACDYYLRGTASTTWQKEVTDPARLREIRAGNKGEINATVMERLCLPGRHWRLKAVRFINVTDRHNTLVQESSALVFSRKEQYMIGNILFMDHLLEDKGIFVLKEAPPSHVQLHYPGCDFANKINDIKLVGIGIKPNDLNPTEWIRCYGFVTGVTSGGQYGRLCALRQYQEQVRIRELGRDEMIMMNTWGDRNQGKKLCEAFAIAELKAVARLGITHFQLDEGWQTTIKLDDPDIFKVNMKRFPNGLAPVVKRGKELGIELCLWTWAEPGADHTYNNWRNLSNAMIQLYKNDGIRTFKFDGVRLPEKLAETNIRNILQTVMEATDNEAIFNMDITADNRYGCHYFNEFGNYYVENRYSDWGNYYPHWTLRNLWMLSRYVPPQCLQIEFLNKWRSLNMYPAGDPLSPIKIPFDYIFATTMMGQPLAFFEGTGLPEEGFAIAPIIKKYREHQIEIHKGQIFPIGQEPCGTGWTGFQSVNGKTGYFLVFRELNDLPRAALRTWNLAGRKVDCRLVLGRGADFTATPDADSRITFALPEPFTFALYEYSVK